MNMNIIFIEKLILMARIGIDDWEKTRVQRLILDLELGCYYKKVKYSSINLVEYLNYSNITKYILDLVSNNKFYLLEIMADQIAEKLITQFEVPWLRMKISKPEAVPQASNVGVIIERCR